MSYRRMNVVRSFQVGLWSCAVPLVFVGAGALVATEAHAQSVPCEPGMLFCDDFSSGVIDPDRYEVFGGATMWIEDGVLMVHMPDDESGFRVNTQDFGALPQVFRVEYELIGELPVGGMLSMDVQGRHPGFTEEFGVSGMSVWRPFWNRCIFVIRDAEENIVGCIAPPQRGHPNGKSCSEYLGVSPGDVFPARQLEFQFSKSTEDTKNRPKGTTQLRTIIYDRPLPKPEPPSDCCFPHDGMGCDDPKCVKLVCALDPFCCDVAWDGLCAQLALEHCFWLVCEKPKEPKEDPREVLHSLKRNVLPTYCHTQELGQFEAGVTNTDGWTLKYLGDRHEQDDAALGDCYPVPDKGDRDDDSSGEGGLAGAPSGATVAIHHFALLAAPLESPPPPSVEVDPAIVHPGDVMTILIDTNVVTLGPDATLDMGPDVLVHELTILGPDAAEAVIEIDPRASGGGRFGLISSGDHFDFVPFTIETPCPIDVPDNLPPTVAIDAPNLVKPGEEFTVNTLWDDPDDLFIRAVLVVFEESTDEEFFSTDFFHLFPTHPDPVEMSFTVPGLPAGYYQIYAVADDGLEWDVQYSPLYVADTAPPCPADLTGDGNVDVFDLLQLLTCWGSTVAGCEQADLTESGSVGVFDLLELLADWGPCPQ